MSKPILRIDFRGFWDTENIIFNEYFRNSHRFLFSKYDVIVDPSNPDVVFCSVFGQMNLSDVTVPTIMLIHENVMPKAAWFSIFTYVVSFAVNMQHHRNHFRIPYWAYRFYEHDFDPLRLQTKHVTEDMYDERRFCNFVYSNPFFFRRDFAHRISSEYRQIDFAGKVDTNIPDEERAEITPSKLGMEGLCQKTAFLNKYRFTFTFENSSTNGYTTEKITDAFIGNTVPLYWGNKLVKRDGFNPRAMLNFFDSISADEYIKRVKEVDSDKGLYLATLAEPTFRLLPDFLDSGYMLDLYERMIERRA